MNKGNSAKDKADDQENSAQSAEKDDRQKSVASKYGYKHNPSGYIPDETKSDPAATSTPFCSPTSIAAALLAGKNIAGTTKAPLDAAPPSVPSAEPVSFGRRMSASADCAASTLAQLNIPSGGASASHGSPSKNSLAPANASSARAVAGMGSAAETSSTPLSPASSTSIPSVKVAAPPTVDAPKLTIRLADIDEFEELERLASASSNIQAPESLQAPVSPSGFSLSAIGSFRGAGDAATAQLPSLKPSVSPRSGRRNLSTKGGVLQAVRAAVGFKASQQDGLEDVVVNPLSNALSVAPTLSQGKASGLTSTVTSSGGNQLTAKTNVGNMETLRIDLPSSDVMRASVTQRVPPGALRTSGGRKKRP